MIAVPAFDRLAVGGSIRAMNSMPVTINQTTYLHVNEAVVAMGCTDGWVRMMCREGRLPGAIKAAERAWLIPVESARAAKLELTNRAKSAQATKVASVKPKSRKK
jgi:hypothetical protein